MSKVPELLASESDAEADGHAAPRTLIDELLAEQQRLTAVDQFVRVHDRDGLPAQARYYRDLLPLERPGPGQQYAFAVDLDACTGCKACVSACHSLNGLDDDEIWRNVGTLHGGPVTAPYQQTITTACHHCLEPACLEGCPVLAYDKDPVTGIVRHLDDQCIGCQYCVLKCPYDVPKYSPKRGIVRKCDLCSSRLAVGEAPACVQACPTEAIRIDVIEVESFERDLRPGETLVPGAFASSYTKPTTRYRRERPMPADAAPADAHALRLEAPHWPLIFMLVFTQMAVGVYGVVALLGAHATAARALVSVGFAALSLGLAVSVLHLGRPLGAWRFFLGLRTSWMSREILAFTVLGGGAGLCTAAAWLPLLQSLTTTAALGTTLLGAVAIFCSAMIYIDTRRALWRARLTLPSFFGTTALLGTAASAAVLCWLPLPGWARGLGIAATFIRTGLFGWEMATFLAAWRDPVKETHRSARTLVHHRRGLLWLRVVLFFASTTLGLAALAQTGHTAALAATASFLMTATSQILGRYGYFVSVVAPRMPGGIPA